MFYEKRRYYIAAISKISPDINHGVIISEIHKYRFVILTEEIMK